MLGSCGTKKRVAKSDRTDIQDIVVKHEETDPVRKGNEPIQPTGDVTLDYINTYSAIAMEEMRKFNIPASITLAQGILESSSGRSELTRRSNNHFGIKCHKGWDGKRAYHDDDRKGECFRVYEYPAVSYRDHSLFLANRERYSSLFKLKLDDYEGWAKGLSKAGYATDRRYPAKLIALIEKYQLDRFDAAVLGQNYTPAKKKWRTVYTVKKGDTLYSISKSFGVTVDEIKRLNNLKNSTISIGELLVIKK
jgi:flagellum-specific peptidoglycan hydrolase FlgJ